MQHPLRPRRSQPRRLSALRLHRRRAQKGIKGLLVALGAEMAELVRELETIQDRSFQRVCTGDADTGALERLGRALRNADALRIGIEAAADLASPWAEGGAANVGAALDAICLPAMRARIAARWPDTALHTRLHSRSFR